MDSGQFTTVTNIIHTAAVLNTHPPTHLIKCYKIKLHAGCDCTRTNAISVSPISLHDPFCRGISRAAALWSKPQTWVDISHLASRLTLGEVSHVNVSWNFANMNNQSQREDTVPQWRTLRAFHSGYLYLWYLGRYSQVRSPIGQAFRSCMSD